MLRNECIGSTGVSAACASQHPECVCVLSVEQDGKRHVVGRVLFSLEGEFGQVGRVLWRDLETEEDPQVHTKQPHTHTHRTAHECKAKSS